MYVLKKEPRYTCTCAIVHVVPQNISIDHRSTILYRTSMKFCIQEELLLSFLDTKFHLHPLQNGRMTSD